MNTGDEILFNHYEWRVLDIQNDMALIITKYVISQHAYHHKHVEVTWADCELRKFLNGTFYKSFNKAERARIVPVTNTNPDNQWYGANGGKDTHDRIFLLSIEETACKYFGDSSERLYNRGKNQRYWFQKPDTNNTQRMTTFNRGGWSWWLRSPGRLNKTAAYIHGSGEIGIQGNNVSTLGGVRPALWLRV